ncbi:ABC transporter ATP-binding protein [Brevibacillus dissolubilis]|uniref:ABC transporter ATP-binding protein n=1 Tax=Brevibacillus dissolubilis TaxID=1844116 RepID=UPI001116F3AD|nr:ABC transporter ATP-binding protein [Brevibacillus dissolubilis]
MAITNRVPFEDKDFEQEQKRKIIEVKNISFQYSSQQQAVLQNIDLHLHSNEFVCVLGPSGCGKSSLLNIIAGFQKPTTGEVQIEGKHYSKPISEIGVVFQHHNLFPWMKIKENVGFGLKMKGHSKEEIEKQVHHFLQLVQLESAGDLLPHQLSGGMKQRAAIARTLAADPKAILMDEPFSSLDALTKENMQHHLLLLWSETKKTIFFITHDVDEALRLGTRILVMQPNPGKIAIDMANPLKRNNPAAVDFHHKEFQELRSYLIGAIKTS